MRRVFQREVCYPALLSTVVKVFFLRQYNGARNLSREAISFKALSISWMLEEELPECRSSKQGDGVGESFSSSQIALFSHNVYREKEFFDAKVTVLYDFF